MCCILKTCSCAWLSTGWCCTAASRSTPWSEDFAGTCGVQAEPCAPAGPAGVGQPWKGVVGKAKMWNRKRHTVMLSLPWQGERPWDGFCCWNLAPNGAVTPRDGHSPADRRWPSHSQAKSSKGLVSQEGSASGVLKHHFSHPSSVTAQ